MSVGICMVRVGVYVKYLTEDNMILIHICWSILNYIYLIKYYNINSCKIK